MLSELLDLARADRPLWMPELREAFINDPTARPLVLRLRLHDGTERDFPTALPRWKSDEERQLAAEFLYASVYNGLAACSGTELRLFFDTGDAELCALADTLDAVFQVAGRERRGYGKVVSIANRIARSRGGADFRFSREDLRACAPLPPEPEREAPAALDERLRALCRALPLEPGFCGIDVGGTDIKLALYAKGRLARTKEFDWNPAAYGTAEEIIEPILLLTRLMRACLHGETGHGISVTVEKLLDEACRRDAPLELIRAAVEAAEDLYPLRRDLLGGVGLSFPDIVIGDRILGGETPKTSGMRRNAALEYEAAFARLSGLKEALLALCREGGRVRITNDGNMAAFTAAMELAHSPAAAELRNGVVAHTLGTDLGTGWLTAEGQIPELPMEMYDMILDLGSFVSRAYPPEDLRSTRNENSGLPGARRYMGQAAAYRLARKLEPSLLDGFTAQEGELLSVRLTPEDMRKPCLEQLMRLAEEGEAAACEVFREIGVNLSVMAREMDYLLHPAARTRFLFGRFVKRPAVFALLEKGFHEGCPELRLVPSDGELARTPLMRALAESREATVAQFGQAVGAIYFALEARRNTSI